MGSLMRDKPAAADFSLATCRADVYSALAGNLDVRMITCRGNAGFNIEIVRWGRTRGVVLRRYGIMRAAVRHLFTTN